MNSYDKKNDFLKFTKGLIIGFVFFCSIALYISLQGFIRHNYFRITLVLAVITYLFMLYTIVKYALEKDNGLFFWFAGLNCLCWMFADVIWLTLCGFNITYDKDLFNAIDFKWECLWIFALALMTLLSLPVANKLSRKIGSCDGVKSKKTHMPFALLVIIFVPRFMNYLKGMVTNNIFNGIVMLIALVVFWALQVVSYSFLIVRTRKAKI